MKPIGRSTPPIPGLYVFPGLLPEDVQGEILGEVARAGVFRGGKRDQVMFFPSTSSTSTSGISTPISASTSTSTSTSISNSTSTSNRTPIRTSTNKDKDNDKIPENNKSKNDSNPEFLTKTLRIVEALLRGKVEEEVFRLLFDDHDHEQDHDQDSQNDHSHSHTQKQRQKSRRRQSQSQRQRQSILNLYPPGTGITPHVDLPGRYGDGIVGVCLGSGVGVRFEEVDLFAKGGEEGEGGLWGDEEEDKAESDEEGEGGRQYEDKDKREIDDGPAEEPHKRARKKRKERRTSYEVYLPRGTVYILSGEARWSWMHGIEPRGEDLVWDDDGSEEGDDVYDTSVDLGVDRTDGDDDETRQEGLLDATSGLGSAKENPRKRRRIQHTSKRSKPRTATRILRDTRVSITYRCLKAQPRRGTRKAREDGNESEQADGGFGGILLEDPVGEGDDWNVR